MYNWQKENLKITKSSKILIGLGDSFTQGQGACDLDIWKKYNWNTKKMYDKYNDDVVRSGYENSWVNQICKNHLKDYTPINLGMSGKGNRAAVKELYLYPELNIESAKEKIVVFMLTGYERFDFVKKDYEVSHNHFTTAWPNDDQEDIKGLGINYLNHIWSERSGLMELLLTIAELKTWCKLHKAKLIITSAFTTVYERSYFIQEIIGKSLHSEIKYIKKLVDIIDWSEFLYPGDQNCITDFLLTLEGREDLINSGTSWPYYEFAYDQKTISPNQFISKCAHPSFSGHKEIAKIIYEDLSKIK